MFSHLSLVCSQVSLKHYRYRGVWNMSKKFIPRPKRPIDKVIIQRRILDHSAAQVEATLRVSSMSETFTGGNLTIAWACAFAGVVFHVALILVREGDSANALNLASGDLYKPEENLLYHRSFVSDHADHVIANVSAKIKTMRKMKSGDSLLLTTKGSSANNGDFNAVFSGFFKQ